MDSLFTIQPDEHLDLIQRARQVRDQLRKRMSDHFAKREAIAKKLNEHTAERDDAINGNHPGTPAEIIAAIRAAHARVERDEADMESALEFQRQLKQSLLKAQADLELAIGGIQRDLIEVIATVEPAKHETAASLRTARQQSVADACVKALIAMGGRASCVDLASLVGVSAHGLGGLIDWDKRMVKEHDGRLQNQTTWYRVAD